jgi:predicted O-methyltransferase YrrM
VTEPDTYSYSRYLSAKATVDERALNQRVWTQFVDRLAERSSPVRILEVGGGVGATVERVVEAFEHEPTRALRYTLVDVEAENVAAAQERLRGWARRRGYSVSGADTQTWSDGPMEVSVRFVHADLFDVASAEDDSSYDAIIAQAVLDLLNIPVALRALRPLHGAGGLWYLPIHFDGVTAFEPPVGPALDARIERLYHESMAGTPDRYGGAAGVHCGRRLLTHLPEADVPLLHAGASDWIVVPRDGAYPADEAYFLHHILHFVEAELSGHPELDAQPFADWLSTRRRQIDEGELVYVAHQLDVLAQTP